MSNAAPAVPGRKAWPLVLPAVCSRMPEHSVSRKFSAMGGTQIGVQERKGQGDLAALAETALCFGITA